MAEFFIEIASEEIPARMQTDAAERFQAVLEEGLKSGGLAPSKLEACCGPRRLVACAEGLPMRAPDSVIERRGPRTNAPKAAVEGFLRASGLATIDDAEIVGDKNGPYYLARRRDKGGATADLLGELLPSLLKQMVWPKSMLWGASSGMRWVRPIRSIACLLDGKMVDFSYAGVKSGATTPGHRIMGPGEPIEVTDFDGYEAILRDKGKVILRAGERIARIRDGLEELCAAHDLEAVDDAALLHEVAGLVEWPMPLIGKMERDFLELPEVLIRESMRTHQKYFATRRAERKTLAPYFIVVANLDAPDGGKEIVAGNERVLSARLSDARYFWTGDRKTRLEDRHVALAGLVFHRFHMQTSKGKLKVRFTMADKTRAMEMVIEVLTSATKEIVHDLASRLSDCTLSIDMAIDDARRAARLSKCDLLTQTVAEFPGLQGRIGAELARKDGEATAVATAIGGQYVRHRVDGEASCYDNENLPADILALADSIADLAGLWLVGERASGNKDRFGMRRAALRTIRILYAYRAVWDCPFGSEVYWPEEHDKLAGSKGKKAPSLNDLFDCAQGPGFSGPTLEETNKKQLTAALKLDGLVPFVVERFKTWLAEGGTGKKVRRDCIDATFREECSVDINARWAKALHDFLDKMPDEADRLLAATARIANILRTETGKLPAEPDPVLFRHDAEKNLWDVREKIRDDLTSFTLPEGYLPYYEIAEILPDPVANFFDSVRVDDDDSKIRRNRLALLASLKQTLWRVADFSKIS